MVCGTPQKLSDVLSSTYFNLFLEGKVAVSINEQLILERKDHDVKVGDRVLAIPIVVGG